MDNAIHHITLYPLDSAIGSPNTYQLDSDLSSGQCYPSFEQQGPDVCTNYSQARSSVPPINEWPLMNYYSKFESVGSCTYQIISALLHVYHLSFPEFDVNVF